jgi:hypothetical protein
MAYIALSVENHSPDHSPQGRGAAPKGNFLLIRKKVIAAEAGLPLSLGREPVPMDREGWGERFAAPLTVCRSPLTV